MFARICLTLLIGMACTAAFAQEKPAKPAATPADPRGLFWAYGGINSKEGDGKIRENEFGVICASRDGEHWEEVFKGGMMKEKQTHGENNGVTGLARGKGRIVAVGSKGIGAIVSDDGRKWTHTTKLGDGITCGPGGFAFGNDMFVIANVVEFLVSEDGTKWEKRPHWKQTEKLHGVSVWDAKGPGHVRGMVFGNNVFVIYGEKRTGTTKDARTFLYHEVTPGNHALLFGAGKFLVLNSNGHRISKDGLEWKPLTIDLDDKDALKFQNSGLWTGEEFVVSGKQCVYRSKDGVSWTKTAIKKGHSSLKAANPRVLAGSLWPTGFTFSRDGGENWAKVPSEFTAYRIQWLPDN